MPITDERCVFLDKFTCGDGKRLRTAACRARLDASVFEYAMGRRISEFILWLRPLYMMLCSCAHTQASAADATSAHHDLLIRMQAPSHPATSRGPHKVAKNTSTTPRCRRKPHHKQDHDVVSTNSNTSAKAKTTKQEPLEMCARAARTCLHEEVASVASGLPMSASDSQPQRRRPCPP